MSAEQSAHLRAQALRFVRVTAYALLAQLLLTGWAWPGWVGLWSLLAGAAETGLRQVMPVRLLPTVASVLSPGVPPLGLPTVSDGSSVMRTAPATGIPMTGIGVQPGETGMAANPPSEPPSPGAT